MMIICINFTNNTASQGLNKNFENSLHVKGIRSNCSLAILNLPLPVVPGGQREGGGFTKPFELFPRSQFM